LETITNKRLKVHCYFLHIIFLDKAERLLAEAASYGSQLVVFPEAFIGGYPRGSNFGVTIGNRTLKGKEDFRKYHAAAITVPGKTVNKTHYQEIATYFHYIYIYIYIYI